MLLFNYFISCTIFLIIVLIVRDLTRRLDIVFTIHPECIPPLAGRILSFLLGNGLTIKVLWPNGNIKHIRKWRNGKKDGLEEIATSNGYPERVIKWIRGRKHGIEMIFHPDRLDIKTAIQWENGLKHGLEKIGRSNGYTERITGWSRGRKHGTETIYYANDEGVRTTIQWENGLKNGTESTTVSGKIMEPRHIIQWKNGKRNGLEIIVRRNGDKCFKQWENENLIHFRKEYAENKDLIHRMKYIIDNY